MTHWVIKLYPLHFLTAYAIDRPPVRGLRMNDAVITCFIIRVSQNSHLKNWTFSFSLTVSLLQQLSITFNNDTFYIKLPEGTMMSFPNRFGDDVFKHMHVKGDVKIISIKIKWAGRSCSSVAPVFSVFFTSFCVHWMYQRKCQINPLTECERTRWVFFGFEQFEMNDCPAMVINPVYIHIHLYLWVYICQKAPWFNHLND